MPAKKKKPVTKKLVKKSPPKRNAVKNKEVTMSFSGTIPECYRQTETCMELPLDYVIDTVCDRLTSINKLVCYVDKKHKATAMKQRGKLGNWKTVPISKLNRKDKEIVKVVLMLKKLVKVK